MAKWGAGSGTGYCVLGHFVVTKGAPTLLDTSSFHRSFTTYIRDTPGKGLTPGLESCALCLGGVKYIDPVSLALFSNPYITPPFQASALPTPWSCPRQASGSHLDLDHAPYVLYGVINILAQLPLRSSQTSGSDLDLIRAPYGLYGVKYIALVSLSRNETGADGRPISNYNIAPLDLNRAPYGLYGLTILTWFPLRPPGPCCSVTNTGFAAHFNIAPLDLNRAPYVVYGIHIFNI